MNALSIAAIDLLAIFGIAAAVLLLGWLGGKFFDIIQGPER